MKLKICRRCLDQGRLTFEPPLLLAPKEEMRFTMDKDYNLQSIEKGFPGKMEYVEFDLGLCLACRS